jgi:hypothetical protein
MLIQNPIANLTVNFASGGNLYGQGTLTATDGTHLKWADSGGVFGALESFNPSDTKIVEGADGGRYLRISCTGAPFSIGSSQITLNSAVNNVYGMGSVSIAQAAAGISQYRGIIAKCKNAGGIQNLRKWLAELAIQQVSDVGHLGGAGAGTIKTSGTFTGWPASGYAQIYNGATLREIVYYSSISTTTVSNDTLNVPANGRALLGSSAAAGNAADTIHSVSGCAIAIDPAGVTAPGAIETIANETTAPAGVTWNTGITAASGLQIGTMASNQQVGIWIWRQIPAGAIVSPLVFDRFLTSFDAT